MAEKEYIERDAAIKAQCYDCGNEGFCSTECDAVTSIRRIPAADVRPVVRGKWVNYGDEYCPDIKCCVCAQRKPILLGNFNFNFCPNCGADMRGEADEKA